MGYRLNRLDEPVFMEVPKSMQTEFGIHYILESCGLSANPSPWSLSKVPVIIFWVVWGGNGH